MASFHLVGDFLERHAIDPNPTNFELVYRHQVSRESGLDHIINSLIANDVLEGSIPESADVAFDAELSEIADFATTQLEAIEVILERSKSEAKGYGTALEKEARGVENSGVPGKFVDSLVKLTRTMISKTKEAEEELNSRKATMNELQNSLAEARVRADTDALTGLSNRRAFERELGAACERANFGEKQLSLAICDVDHFKSINDRFGHVTGDRVLQLVGDILRTHCLDQGKIFRFGGEEFVILFEGLEVKEANALVDRTRRDLASRKIVKKETGEELGAITFSGGICDYTTASSPEEMLKLADKSLYRAKANGRNIILTA